jgi:hypothetical protein
MFDSANRLKKQLQKVALQLNVRFREPIALYLVTPRHICFERQEFLLQTTMNLHHLHLIDSTLSLER